MTLFAQHGYGKSTKIERGIQQGLLSGVILSPKDESEPNLRSYVQSLRSDFPHIEVMLDPQFYHVPIPNANVRNLPSYANLYPGPLPLSSFRGRQIQTYVNDVLNYQDQLGTSYLVSPSIIVNSFSDREAQVVLNLAQEAIDLHKQNNYNQSDLLISLTIHETAFTNTAQMDSFLNEISILDAKGFYLIIVRNTSDYNQLFDNNTALVNILTFIYSLSEINEFRVIMGYSDFLGLLYLSVGAYSIATGWHNSLRKFTMKRILPSTGGRQPRPRYSSAPLLNSILLSELDSAFQQTSVMAQIMSGTTYDNNINSAPNPLSAVWDKDTGQMEHWAAINSAITNIISGKPTVTDKLDSLEQAIIRAQGLYSILHSRYVPLETNSNSDHLTIWNTAIADFRALTNV
ncbi:hypothetical protein [Brevibacillus nitrificans]|uniref:hypothetical protein n=1 Tax=Brevibacillus nitrificans TaxID=651560 RepID=UPI00261262CA|nr:hypothetical protein [Brevibacillus nitrificans]